MFLRFLFLAGLAGLGLSACHMTPIENPSVPPISVAPTPYPGPFNYTDQGDAPLMKLKKRVAVARFNDNIPVKESPFGTKRQVDIVGHNVQVHQEEILPEEHFVPQEFTERLMDALSNTKRFVLVERKDINALLREVSFTETKFVDRAKSAKLGKVLGAQIIITGAMLLNEDPVTSASQPYALFLRMYDVETSRIVSTARATGNSTQQVIDRAVGVVTMKMDGVNWIGKIASVSGEKLFLNAGSEENVQVGDKFQLFALGTPISDPETKDVIGYQEESAGMARVVAVSDRTATMEVTEKVKPIKVGDKAQFVNQGK